MLPGHATGDKKIGRTPVERDMELRIWKPRALNDRLIITGQEPLYLAQARNAHGRKILLEEGARSRRIARRLPRSLPTEIPQGAVDRAVVLRTGRPAHHLAARLVGGERGKMIVFPPTLELAPMHRLERAVGQLEGVRASGAASGDPPQDRQSMQSRTQRHRAIRS